MNYNARGGFYRIITAGITFCNEESEKDSLSDFSKMKKFSYLLILDCSLFLQMIIYSKKLLKSYTDYNIGHK